MPEIELNTGDRIPHACLICAPSADAALQKAKELAAAAVCSGAGKKPCGICRDTTSAGWRRSSLVVGRGLFSLTVCGLRPRDARFSFFCARSGGVLKAFSLSGWEGRDSAPRES